MTKTADYLQMLDLADVLREFAYDCKQNVDEFWCYDEFREACEKNAARATIFANALVDQARESDSNVWPATVDADEVNDLLRLWYDSVCDYQREAQRNDDEEAFESWSNDREEIERLALALFETVYR